MKNSLIILLFLLIVSAPAGLYGREHLNEKAEAGKIFDVANQKFITEKTLVKRLVTTRNILIAIREDNPDHHRLAAGIIDRIAGKGYAPAILVSNIERNKQNAFTIFNQRHPDPTRIYDASGLDMLLDWSQSGQPEWAIVRPVFDMAMIRRLSVTAVNFSRYEVGRLHQDGLQGLAGDLKDDLVPLLSLPLPEAVKNRQIREADKIFCGRLPPESLKKFTLLHRARNGLFALSLTKIPREKTAILITAQKHVMKDIGIPPYLDELGAAGGNISLSFMAPDPEISLANAKVDFIWLTAKNSPPDPCG